MAGSFDVFFSYSTRDHAAVERVARDLTERGIGVFLDRWYLTPGRPWPQALEQMLAACNAVAVFIGADGLGPWLQRERDLALDRQGREPGFPVIPVLLSRGDPALGFLRLNTWVDLSAGAADEAAIEILAAAIRGQAPGPLARQRIEAVRAEVCPYRGLRPFREEDEPFFFGRGSFTETLTTAIKREPFVAVVGAPGSGKSSVVRAGLIPRLPAPRRGRVRLGYDHPGPHRSAAGKPGGGTAALTGTGSLGSGPAGRGEQAGGRIWRTARSRCATSLPAFCRSKRARIGCCCSSISERTLHPLLPG